MCKVAHFALNYLITHSLTAGRWFSPGTRGTKNKTDSRDIAKILSMVVLNAVAITLNYAYIVYFLNETNWDMNYNLISPCSCGPD